MRLPDALVTDLYLPTRFTSGPVLFGLSEILLFFEAKILSQ